MIKIMKHWNELHMKVIRSPVRVKGMPGVPLITGKGVMISTA